MENFLFIIFFSFTLLIYVPETSFMPWFFFLYYTLGVRKEEIKVEVEDSRYLIIRTEAIDDSTKPAMDFKRKFRLPGSIDIDGISAKYEDGVLTVTVPRTFRRGSFYIDPADVPDRVEVLARAA
ncbi:hypothetical protein PVK06_015274 [Gossypium arboreum]|uniref:SHSP domain-containing protein n=1 Tax=Gossypium arboreum TaxID=29729 RepID=A0ABR0PWV1_GOSAR|nr:hypothetical protein PVK06_015274 [Gossypium arboreum]